VVDLSMIQKGIPKTSLLFGEMGKDQLLSRCLFGLRLFWYCVVKMFLWYCRQQLKQRVSALQCQTWTPCVFELWKKFSHGDG
jgi:hypothetical protein